MFLVPFRQLTHKVTRIDSLKKELFQLKIYEAYKVRTRRPAKVLHSNDNQPFMSFNKGGQRARCGVASRLCWHADMEPFGQIVEAPYSSAWSSWLYDIKLDLLIQEYRDTPLQRDLIWLWKTGKNDSCSSIFNRYCSSQISWNQSRPKLGSTEAQFKASARLLSWALWGLSITRDNLNKRSSSYAKIYSY